MRDIRTRRVTSHVAQKKQHSAIDRRATRHAGYVMSLHLHERVEEVFGWMKTVGGPRSTRYRGAAHMSLAGYLVATARNLVGMANLTAAPETAGVPPGEICRGLCAPSRRSTGPETPRPGVSGPLEPPQHLIPRAIGETDDVSNPFFSSLKEDPTPGIPLNSQLGNRAQTHTEKLLCFYGQRALQRFSERE